MRIGAADASLSGVSGMAAVTELVDRLGVVERLDAAAGLIKQRDRDAKITHRTTRGFGSEPTVPPLERLQLLGERSPRLDCRCSGLTSPSSDHQAGEAEDDR